MKKESNGSSKFTNWAALITAAAALLTAVGLPTILPLLVNSQTTTTEAKQGEENFIRISIRNNESQEALPGVEIEVVHMGNPAYFYTDSAGYADIKLDLTNPAKIYLRKSGFESSNYQIAPDIDIPENNIIPYYLSPEETSEIRDENTRQEDEKSPSIAPPTTAIPPSQPEPIIEREGQQEKPTSPIQFMHSYYETINNGDIENAWGMLSPQFQRNQPNGFSGYKEWWGEKVDRVIIENISIIEEQEQEATVEVDVQYIINGDTKNETPLTYDLGWNRTINNWQIKPKD